MTANTPLRARYRAALFPIALRAVERGEHRGPNHDLAEGRKHTARIVANYSTTDLLLTGRTLALPMTEVAAVLPEFGEAEAA
jgi:hypothetical protein